MHSSIKNTDLEDESVSIQNFDQEFGVAKVILFPLSSHIFQAMILSGGQFLPFLSLPWGTFGCEYFGHQLTDGEACYWYLVCGGQGC